MGALRVEDFLKNNINDKAMLQEALAALTAIRNSEDYDLHAIRIRSECDASSIGLALAQKGNAKWLIDAFSSRGRARIKLGQPLSPGEAQKYILLRQDVIDKLTLISSDLQMSQWYVCWVTRVTGNPGLSHKAGLRSRTSL